MALGILGAMRTGLKSSIPRTLEWKHVVQFLLAQDSCPPESNDTGCVVAVNGAVIPCHFQIRKRGHESLSDLVDGPPSHRRGAPQIRGEPFCEENAATCAGF